MYMLGLTERRTFLDPRRTARREKTGLAQTRQAVRTSNLSVRVCRQGEISGTTKWWIGLPTILFCFLVFARWISCGAKPGFYGTGSGPAGQRRDLNCG